MYFFFKQFGLYKLYLFLLNTIPSSYSVIWICVGVIFPLFHFFFSRLLLALNDMWSFYFFYFIFYTES